MTDAAIEDVEEPQKRSKLPLLMGLVGALAAGGGGFFAVYSGLLLAPTEPTVEQAPTEITPGLDGYDFVEMDPLIVALHPMSAGRNLRFRAQLEVPSEHKEEVEALMPRIVDVLNGYLRALEPRDFDRPGILIQLRTHMLLRIQLIAGADRVRSLLVMEFVTN